MAGTGMTEASSPESGTCDGNFKCDGASLKNARHRPPYSSQIVALEHRRACRPCSDQMQRLAPAAHHAAQQGDEQGSVQATGVGGGPERPLGADRRRGADALALPRHRHHRGLPFGAPRRALHRIDAKVRLIREVNISLVPLGLPGNRWPRGHADRRAAAASAASIRLLYCSSSLLTSLGVPLGVPIWESNGRTKHFNHLRNQGGEVSGHQFFKHLRQIQPVLISARDTLGTHLGNSHVKLACLSGT